LFMLTAIAGGALLQWPLGHISDGHDRRTGLVALSLAAAGIAVVASLPMIQLQTHLLFGLFFFYGGLAFALYPFAVAHMLDYLPREDLLSGCSSLLLVHGVGAALGPAIAGAAMQQFGAPALPLYFAVVLMLLALFTTARLLSFQRLRTHPVGFRLMLRTTPSALELMPETDTAPPDPDISLPSDTDKEVH
ncbi:MAG: MFS transporter, partial [Stenotrophomonas maltophilia]